MNEEEKDILIRINSERETLEFFFKDLAENKKAIITPLIQNAAFMKVTLECLQEKINSEGVTEIYQNGANQCGVKQSATLQSYNSLIKNYASVIKTLSQMLPPEVKNTTLLAFTPREKTEEELAREQLEDEERERKRQENLVLAIEYQRQQRESYAQGNKHFPSLSKWTAKEGMEYLAKSASGIHDISEDE